MPSPMAIALPPRADGNGADFAPSSLASQASSSQTRGMQSPGRGSFLPSFMRRPRAATGDSSSRPPTLGLSEQSCAPSSTSNRGEQPQPNSSDSLASDQGGNAQMSPNNRRRATGPLPRSSSGLPSPSLSSPSRDRDDPLAAFGQRLFRRISNNNGGTQNGGGAVPTSTPPPSSNGFSSDDSRRALPITMRNTAGATAADRESLTNVVASAISGTPPPNASTMTSFDPMATNGSSAIVAHPPSSSANFVTSAGAESSSSQAGLTTATTTSAIPSSAIASSSSSSPAAAAALSSSSPSASSSARTHRIRLVPMLESSHSLAFDPILRDVRESPAPDPMSAGGDNVYALKVGRFTDKQSGADGTPRGGALSSTKVAFKSKVVSRCHAEIWALEGGRFFVKDTRSSSGTFLNHIRLSVPSVESKVFPLKDGDVLQLGVDYQGGTEEIYRCVKMRIEIGRAWQGGANAFNTNALKQLNALGGGTEAVSPAPAAGGSGSKGKKLVKQSVTDCCICLFSVTICQSLFIAPCSHVFHYKCIRPLLAQHHPGFSCPLCRSFADLEADVETEDAWETGSVTSRRESLLSRKGSLKSVKQAFEQGLAHALANAEVEDGGDVEAGVVVAEGGEGEDEALMPPPTGAGGSPDGAATSSSDHQGRSEIARSETLVTPTVVAPLSVSTTTTPAAPTNGHATQEVTSTSTIELTASPIALDPTSSSNAGTSSTHHVTQPELEVVEEETTPTPKHDEQQPAAADVVS